MYATTISWIRNYLYYTCVNIAKWTTFSVIYYDSDLGFFMKSVHFLRSWMITSLWQCLSCDWYDQTSQISPTPSTKQQLFWAVKNSLVWYIGHQPRHWRTQTWTRGTNTVHRKNFPLLETDPDGWMFSVMSTVNSWLSANKDKK